MHAIKNTMNEIEKKSKEKISKDITETKWTRNCPKCNTEISYSTKGHLTRSLITNCVCQHCSRKARSGKPSTFLGKHHSEEAKRKVSEANLNPSEETRRKMSESRRGKNHYLFGKHHSEETKQKMRLAVIARIERNLGQVYPNYNPNACKIIEDYGREYGYNFQHAENGGEYHIKELGYFVDGYDKDKNVVLEVYEPAHKRTIKRDLRRQKEITEHLNCKFIYINI